MMHENLQKRLILQSISLLSKNAIDKLDTVIYYKNMLDIGDEINVKHFEELLETSKKDFYETLNSIKELCESPFL